MSEPRYWIERDPDSTTFVWLMEMGEDGLPHRVSGHSDIEAFEYLIGRSSRDPVAERAALERFKAELERSTQEPKT